MTATISQEEEEITLILGFIDNLTTKVADNFGEIVTPKKEIVYL